MKIKVFTAFSGYDSQCMALDRIRQQYPDFDYELVGWAEIDKYAIQAHNAVYPQWAERNYGDISKIDWAQVPDFDLFTYSSPCQDFSQAGKQAGGEQGSGTRSSLLWECERAIRAKRPKYLLMENVAALVSQKFIRLFNRWQFTLEGYGYSNFSEVLNAKQFGVPQNRERIFMVSIREEAARYEFPKPFPLTFHLKDVLEPKVDERYYLKENIIEGYNIDTVRTINTDADGNASCIRAGYYKAGAANFMEREDGYGQTAVAEPVVYDDYNGKVRADQDTMGTLTTNCGNDAPRNGFKIIEQMIGAFRGRNPENPSELGRSDGMYKQRLEINENGTSNTLTLVQNDNMVIETTYRIRKLTERECFRLMDVDEEYIDRIQAAGISRSQQYKMAGNSIVVACLFHIFHRLFIDTKPTTLTLF